jgi:hypothetical protein
MHKMKVNKDKILDFLMLLLLLAAFFLLLLIF